MNILVFSWKILLRRKVRTFLTLFTIGITVLFFLFFSGLQLGYTKAVVQDIQQFGAHLLAIPKGCPYEATSILLQGGILPKQLKQQALNSIGILPNIQHSYAMLAGLTPSHVEKGSLDRIYGVTSGIQFMKTAWKEISPSSISQFFSQEPFIIVGFKKADTLGVVEGDSIPIGPDQTLFKVLAVLPLVENEEDFLLYLPLPIAQQWFHQEGYITSVAVTLSDVTQLESTVIAIELLEDVQVITMDDVLKSIIQYITMIKSLLIGILVIVIFASSIQVLNVMTINVLEQLKEIAVLKAFGAFGRRISRFIIFQGWIFAFLGTIFGILLAFVLLPILERILHLFITQAPTGPLLSIPFLLLLWSFGLVLVMTTIASLYPLSIASRARPSQIFRQKVNL